MKEKCISCLCDGHVWQEARCRAVDESYGQVRECAEGVLEKSNGRGDVVAGHTGRFLHHPIVRIYVKSESTKVSIERPRRTQVEALIDLIIQFIVDAIFDQTANILRGERDSGEGIYPGQIKPYLEHRCALQSKADLFRTATGTGRECAIEERTGATYCTSATM